MRFDTLMVHVCENASDASEKRCGHGLIPAPLQFIGDQTILRVGRIVLLLRPLRRVARRFQVSLPRGQHLVLLTRDSFARYDWHRRRPVARRA